MGQHPHLTLRIETVVFFPFHSSNVGQPLSVKGSTPGPPHPPVHARILNDRNADLEVIVILGGGEMEKGGVT